ncbi:efflux RND transporter permease subunit [Gracilimonas tropica]|uniref:efflux RND transporter permease subunit n=1 Tax=Gracilimonas tropica TaxID=454600 RepID=UPI0003726122|nr:efflux RND transporter permease subunit [Gracilimonas tropica]
MLNKTIRFFLENKLVAVLLLLILCGWGLAVAPFNWNLDFLPRDRVPVDAIPNLGENQQIIYTEWEGQSPQDIEDQVTYPLTTQLLTVPGIKTVRSNSMTGLSSIYVIFEENVDYYWSRSRILEKLNSLPAGTLPESAKPALGPDATALGQIFWYTLEGRDSEGNPTGGWDPQELRSIQDFYVRYGLSGAQGVAEVASIGGYIKEYQVDINPNKLKTYGVTLPQVIDAVRKANAETGARTVELNNAEYLVRGIGYVQELEDLESAVVKVVEGTPVRIQDVAFVSMGPAPRRGALDKAGAEAVGGVVVARQGANPQAVIDNVKAQIEEISAGLPSKTLEDGTESKVTIVPFYDRSTLISETLGTLEEALTLQILITIIVIVVMVMNLRTSFLISMMLPVAVLMTFIAMKYFGVDANIVALSGIAIAIGTIVDMGVILSENMLRHMEEKVEEESLLEVIYNATVEVAGAVLTAIATTIVSFLPVFTMVAAEGKLFKPLAYTKTFALIASIIITITLIPPFAHWFFGLKIKKPKLKLGWNGVLVIGGFVTMLTISGWGGFLILGFGLINGAGYFLGENYRRRIPLLNNALAVVVVTWLLTTYWLPFGPSVSFFGNLIFIVMIIALILFVFWLIIRYYESIIGWCLDHKKTFLAIPAFFVFFGAMIWLGFAATFGFISKGFNAVGLEISETSVWTAASEAFPGLGEEFMPALDEGAFLYMPTTMPHVGVEEAEDMMQKIDLAVSSIPEVKLVVGKMGRAESALDPAPVSMFENVILYKSEYRTDEDGRRIRFKVNAEGKYERDANGELIPDEDGKYYRQWRDHIQSPDDIWDEIVKVAKVPGTTSAPKLQPIETRLVMLQSGMRAPMGIKVKGNDLREIEDFGLKLEEVLRKVEGIKASSVFAERIVGKPYLEVKWDREQLARYGLNIEDVQQFMSMGVGGMAVSTSVEGRERYPIRVRFARELRDSPEAINELLVPAKTGAQVPLSQLAEIEYRQGPQAIKSEDTFLVGYVIFDKADGFAEIEVVENATADIQQKIENGELEVPAGINFEFAGDYENQVRAEKRLSVILPIALIVIFLIMYFQFKSVATTSMIFSSIFVAWAGGFLLIWLYGQGWFLNFDLFGQNLRDLFQMGTVNLSVAVWVGFIALFGIAADGGVVMATYLDQLFDRKKPASSSELRDVVIEASTRRIRPTLMTTATTILALLPVLTSTGRGSDIMVPMAIPSVGGMFLQIITLLVIPVLYYLWKEFKMNRKIS